MLVLEQNVDVNVRVGGVHSVADQEGAILTIQDLDPDPGELLHWRHDLHFKRLLTRRRRQTVTERIRRRGELFFLKGLHN